MRLVDNAARCGEILIIRPAGDDHIPILGNCHCVRLIQFVISDECGIIQFLGGRVYHRSDFKCNEYDCGYSYFPHETLS